MQVGGSRHRTCSYCSCSSCSSCITSMSPTTSLMRSSSLSTSDWKRLLRSCGGGGRRGQLASGAAGQRERGGGGGNTLQAPTPTSGDSLSSSLKRTGRGQGRAQPRARLPGAVSAGARPDRASAAPRRARASCIAVRAARCEARCRGRREGRAGVGLEPVRRSDAPAAAIGGETGVGKAEFAGSARAGSAVGSGEVAGLRATIVEITGARVRRASSRSRGGLLNPDVCRRASGMVGLRRVLYVASAAGGATTYM
jgi:hypothetical protein